MSNFLPTSPVTVRTLLCKAHLKPGLLCLRSIVESGGENVSLLIHEDGSLDANDIAQLESEIPRAQVVTKASVEPLVAEKLKDFPACREARARNVMFLKMFDIALSEAQTPQNHLRYIDSDILFFRRLSGFFDTPIPAVFGCERGVVLCSPHLRMWRLVRGPMLRGVNGGVFFLDMNWFDLERIEWLIKNVFLPGPKHPHMIDQSLYAMLYARPQTRLVAQEMVQLATDIQPNHPDLAAIHFVGSDKNNAFNYAEKSRETLQMPPMPAKFEVPKTHTLPSILRDMARNGTARVLQKPAK